QSAENAPQVRLQIGADDGVESPQRLIQQQNVRIKHKSPHQPDALALAAGELDGKIIQEVGGEPREVDQLRQPGPNAWLRPTQVAGQQRNVPSRRMRRKEAAVLHYVSHPPSDSQRVVRADWCPGEENGSGIGANEAE